MTVANPVNDFFRSLPKLNNDLFSPEVIVPGDMNVYKNHYSALNAIDEALGGYGNKGKPTQKRLDYGVQIIGKKDASA